MRRRTIGIEQMMRREGLGQALTTDPATTADPIINPAALSPATSITKPVWIDPPENWVNIDQLAYALLPAIGSTVVILSFQCPLGYNALINAVACNFVGGGWVEGSGDVLWRILVDNGPLPNAATYTQIVASLGSPANPVRIPGFRIMENQVLTVVGFNNPAGPSGGVVVAGQRLGARLIGYQYPRQIEGDSIWV